MKRKLLLFLAAAMTFNVCFADIYNIRLLNKQSTNDNVKIRPPKDRSLQISPSAIYDTDTYCLTVTSPVMMYDAHVKVTDAWGETVVDDYFDITKAGVEIQLVSSPESMPYTLEIECGDTCWCGNIG